MSDVRPWPVATARAEDLPKVITRPCDAALRLAWMDLETQLGTVEGYNRLVQLAERIRANIDAGRIKAQNPIYAVHVRGGP